MLKIMTMETWTATDEAAAHAWAAIAIALAVAGGVGLFRAGRDLRDTTLLAPWRWTCFSFATLVCGEVSVAWLSAEGSLACAAHVRYWAGVTTLAPFVALLGAKRPQDRAWQWIVLALLTLLALPSAKAMVFDSGTPPAPHSAWRLLLAVLLASQFANHALTRFWHAALLAGLAQLTWLAGYLPGVEVPRVGHLSLGGLALATAAIWLARRPRSCRWIRKNSGCRRLGHEPIDRVWLDFRDAYGALWALRVAERFNASAVSHGWPARLRWQGMRLAEGVKRQESGVRSQKRAGNGEDGRSVPVAETNVTPAMRQNLKSLLCRFVSPEWIAERLDTRPASPDQ